MDDKAKAKVEELDSANHIKFELRGEENDKAHIRRLVGADPTAARAPPAAAQERPGSPMILRSLL